jgi:hypothetical protein
MRLPGTDEGGRQRKRAVHGRSQCGLAPDLLEWTDVG